ncbi:MAG: hypothetical protein SH817_10985 [Leptospira sp.]|nr:hypothetical protein [Leptospira sp.]
MLRLLLSIFLILSACGGTKSTDSTTAAVLLANESGADGCTITGISNQIKAGYTEIATTSKTVSTRAVQDTYYAVVQVKGGQIGTNIVFNQNLTPYFYKSTSCPLKLDTDVLAAEGTDYTKTLTETSLTFTLLKASSYLIYFYSKTNYEANGLTVVTTGTALQAVSDATLTGILNGSTTTFQFACDDSASTGICQNYYGSFTSCLAGGTKQTSKCTETNVVGSCKLSQSGIGTIVSVYTSPTIADATAASAKCTSGTFQSGSTVQTP